MDLSLDLCASETCHSVPASVELEGMWVGDRWKQDECRRGLTFDDDVYQTLDPLSREPFTQLYLMTENGVNGWER